MAEEGSGRLNSGDGRVNDENIDKRADGVQRASGNDTARSCSARRVNVGKLRSRVPIGADRNVSERCTQSGSREWFENGIRFSENLTPRIGSPLIREGERCPITVMPANGPPLAGRLHRPRPVYIGSKASASELRPPRDRI